MEKNIFCILAISILFISCEKKSAVIPAYNLPKEALAYVQIPLKKYFIYKDSVSGNIDSVIVSKSELENKVMPANQSKGPIGLNASPYDYQTFTLLLTKVNGTMSTDWFFGFSNASEYYGTYGSASVHLWLAEKDRSTNKTMREVFHYPHSNDGISPYVLVNIPNITIEGKSYTDIVQFTGKFNAKYTYYWAKGIGIIKRSLTTGTSTQTWTLLRHG